MAHRRRNKPETGICREPPAWLEGCSSIIGLYYKKLLEQDANREKLIAAGFLLPQEPSKPPEPKVQISFAEWDKQRELK
ncbi:MAG: hypothetical protein R3E61_03560 [Pseudomonadales bacterium]